MPRTELQFKFGILLLLIAIFAVILIAIGAVAVTEYAARLGFGFTGGIVLLFAIYAAIRLDRLESKKTE